MSAAEIPTTTGAGAAAIRRAIWPASCGILPGNGLLLCPARELAALKEARDAVWTLLEKAGVDDLHDYDAFFDYFYDEDARFEYVLAFRRFTSALNTVMPRKEALDYLEEYLQFSEINVQATQHLRDGRLSMKGIPEKLRRVTDAHLRAKGIDQKVEPISILDEDFLSEVGQRKRTKTKAAAVEHALRHQRIRLTGRAQGDGGRGRGLPPRHDGGGQDQEGRRRARTDRARREPRHPRHGRRAGGGQSPPGSRAASAM